MVPNFFLTRNRVLSFPFDNAKPIVYENGTTKGGTMAKRKKKRKTLAEQLIEAIEKSELSRYRISKETGLAASALSEFVNRNRDLSLGNADKLCEILNLELKKTN